MYLSDRCDNTLVQNNEFYDLDSGIESVSSNDTIIAGNTFTEVIFGILLDKCEGTIIVNNSMENNRLAIEMIGSSSVLIAKNNFITNRYGIYIDDTSQYITINYNNFIDRDHMTPN